MLQTCISVDDDNAHQNEIKKKRLMPLKFRHVPKAVDIIIKIGKNGTKHEDVLDSVILLIRSSIIINHMKRNFA